MRLAHWQVVAGARERSLFLLNLLALVTIIVLDWATPAGVVIGILACIPIVLSSMSDDPRQVWIITGVAIVGKVLAMTYGQGPITPAVVWVPNRILAFLALPACGVVAFQLQRRRLDLVRARDRAVSASELNRLLMSLLAHDLRSPLAVSDQVLDYVSTALKQSRPVDPDLINDARMRLRRSLRAIDIVLGLARTESNGGEQATATAVYGPAAVAKEIEAEIASFRQEAAAHRKELVTEIELEPGSYGVNVLVLRQVLAILVDNAIRYAVPGQVRVSARVEGRELRVRVADPGPATSSQWKGGPKSAGGSGLGLELCRSLVRNAGGSLELERDSPEGTSFVLRLPATPLGGA